MVRIQVKLVFVMVLFLAGCANQRMSTIVGFNYDESKNQTDYFELPFGSVSIPGKWDKSNYNSVSGQQFFTNKDSISIAIAFNRFDKYEFNAGGEIKGYDFLEAFYEWDSKYFVDSFGLQRRVLENDSIRNYFLYQIYGFSRGVKVDTYFLIGENNGNVYSFSIMTNDKWSEERKIDFLKKLYLKE